MSPNEPDLPCETGHPQMRSLDSDVFAKRPFGLADLLVDGGRALIQGERQSGSTQHQRSWWRAASQIFHAPQCVRTDTPTVGVTPALLVATVAVAAIERIEALWGRNRLTRVPWDTLLFERLAHCDWSEYTLYCARERAASLSPSTDKPYHPTDDRRGIPLMSRAIPLMTVEPSH